MCDKLMESSALLQINRGVMRSNRSLSKKKKRARLIKLQHRLQCGKRQCRIKLHLPITIPALAPGLSPFTTSTAAAPPVVVFVPPVSHVVFGLALNNGLFEDCGTAPMDPKPGKNA